MEVHSEYSWFCENILNFRVVYDIINIYLLEWRDTMSVSYDKLWKTLIDRKMNRTELKDLAGVSFNIIAKLGKNEFVSMESMYKICLALKCDISDIMEFTNYEQT